MLNIQIQTSKDMNDTERIRELKLQLHDRIPPIFLDGQLSVVKGLLYDAVDEAIDLVKNLNSSNT